MGDAVRPSKNAFKATFEKGYQIWSNLREVATTSKVQPLQHHLSQMRTVFPHHPCLLNDLAIDWSSPSFPFAKGTSSWKTASGCDLPSFDQELFIPIGTYNPTTVVISDMPNSRFSSIRVFEEENDHTAILVHAWTHILSARWAELMPEAHGPEFTMRKPDCIDTDDVPKPFKDDSTNTIVYLGEVDDDGTRWWSAVLAIEGGWNVSIQTQGGGTMYPPWYTRIVSDRQFTLSRVRKSHTALGQTCPPPSFATALKYLSEYCQLHEVGDQNQAALAITILIPAARFDNRVMHFHVPRFSCPNATAKHISSKNFSWCNNLVQLDRLLTLSCNPLGVKALLSSVFFEPGVECNISGAWLQGIRSVTTRAPSL